MTGDAKLTKGYRLPARFIIHTVGPVWNGGASDEPALLASCYRRSLEVALQKELRSVAFPSISTGIYGYPIELAVPIAVGTVRAIAANHPSLDEIIFCCFSAEYLAHYQRHLAALSSHISD